MTSESEKRLHKEITHLKETLLQKERKIESLKGDAFFLKTLFQGINEEIMVIDKNYVIQDVNETFLTRVRLEKADVIGRKCHEVTYHSNTPCNFEKNVCPLEKVLETGQRIEVTHCHENHEGEVREYVRVVYPLLRENTLSEYFVEISRDVTEYRNLINRLKASEKKFKTILDTATDAILSIDSQQRIVLFNNAAERIFGYSRGEVMGRNLNMLIPKQYGDHYRFVKRFIETKTPRIIGKTLALRALRKGGEEFPIELGLSFHQTGEDITFTAIIRDVTAQKQLETRLLRTERLAAMGQTVAHVAHEIKNPLMIIGGFSEQIKKNLTDRKAVNKLEMILDEVGRLERLVRNLGDFTKEYTLVKRPADIGLVIQDVLKIITEIYPKGKYHLVTNWLAEELKEIHCDPDKLKQVFMNLIANGLEAMEAGGTIRISVGDYSQGIEIRIHDEGVGIMEEDLLRIFEPFFTTRERGSGLGLCISYKIVQAHGGDIWAESIAGEGTTFVIRLPSE